MVNKNNKKSKNKKIKKNKNYKIKIVILIIALCCMFAFLVFEINYGTKALKKKSTTYSKSTNTNYVVYLKTNDHYSNNYLEDSYNYVSNLIDYFNIDFAYSYVLNEKIKYTLEYEVVGVLEIFDSEDKSKPIEKKKYQILDKQIVEEEGQLIKIDLFNQKIDYENYNSLVKEWKKEINPEATLKIMFNVEWKGFSPTLNKEISDSNTTNFDIPISQKVISIHKPAPVSDNGVLYANKKFNLGYFIMLASTGLIIVIIAISLIIMIMKKSKEKSKYDQKLNKILREFDRAITEATGTFEKNDTNHYIEVKEFMELMDVHDNLNEPIICYKNSNDECVFVVRNGGDIYYTSLNRSDYD